MLNGPTTEVEEVNLHDEDNHKPVFIRRWHNTPQGGSIGHSRHKLKYVFAWSYEDMDGVSYEVIMHNTQQSQRRHYPQQLPSPVYWALTGKKGL